VTLEGERADWEKLVLRLNKLPSFGPEPAAWARLLHPVLSRFVQAFDGKPDVDFWNRVCDYRPLGSGASSMTGWLSAFCVWSEQGKWQGLPLDTGVVGHGRSVNVCVLDGVPYPVIYKVPIAFCELDVKLVGDGEEARGMMVAGHIGRLTEGERRDTIRPLLGWFMFVKG
jgi:hypothetical protein